MTTTHGLVRTQLAAVASAVQSGTDRVATLRWFDDLGTILDVTDGDEAPRWSALTDDCSPFELSLGFRAAGPVLRVLFEAQDSPPGPQSYWDRAVRVTSWLGETHGLDLDRLTTIRDLYRPIDPNAFWAMWHSVDFAADGPVVRVYLNPRAAGIDATEAAVTETLRRLGLASSWPLVASVSSRLGARPVVVTLELTQAGPRVGIHLLVPAATSDDLELVIAALRNGGVGDAELLLDTMTGSKRADRRSIFVTLQVDTDGIGALGIAVPCVPYAPNDAIAAQRISRLFDRHGLSAAPYLAALGAFVPDAKSLSTTQGVNSFVSFVRSNGEPRISVAFGSRLYAARFGWLALDPPRWWPSPVEI